MPWALLILAIICEVAGTTCMKASDGFKKLPQSVGMIVLYILCFALLGLAVKKIDISVAYAVWAGLGTALIAAVGMTLFREPVTPLKIGSIFLIIAGVVGLNLSGGAH